MNTFESASSLVGQIVAGRWQIIEFLGDGNMSHVYKAQDIETDKIVVLKLIKSNLLQPIPDLTVLEEQARNYIALNHENISNYYNIHIDSDKRLFLFFDYLQGESFAAMLAREAKLSLETSIQIFQQVSAGLEYAYEKKIWHGDLRPSNVFIVNDQFSVDEAKIVDFGFMTLLQRLSKNKHDHSTTSNPAIPNAAYMSPEQKAGHSIDQRSDIYTLGCLMYEAVAGKPPFIGSTIMTTAYKQKQQTTTGLHEILQPEPVLIRYQQIVDKCLKTNYLERYQSPSDLKADLNLLLIASEKEWRKKAHALKRSTYALLTTRLLPALISIFILTLAVTGVTRVTTIIGPYIQPWTGTPDFDNNKLWLATERQLPKPTNLVLKQKKILADKLTQLEKNHLQNSPDYAQTLFYYARALLGCGQWQEAQAALTKVQQIQSQQKEPNNNKVRQADILAHLAFAYFMLSNLPAAEQYSKQVLNMVKQSPQEIGDKITALRIMGDITNGANDNKHALEFYKQLYELATTTRLRNPSLYAHACAFLADTYSKEYQYAQAEKLYQEAIDWGANFVGSKQLFMANAFYGLALVQYHLGELGSAMNQLQQALPIAIACQGEESNFVKSIKRFHDYLLFHENPITWWQSRQALNKVQSKAPTKPH